MEMTIWKALFLGIIQGATEFLPVSSSGHLVLFQNLFGLKEGALTFDIFLHFGTLLAVTVYFWDDIKNMLLFKKSHRHLMIMVLIGIIPTGLIGFFFEDLFAKFFNALPLVGLMWVVTGTLLYTTEKMANTYKPLEKMRVRDALSVGLAQGMAIIPGISRSGSTIATSLFRGLKREDAARYSMIISLPVIFGATLLEAKNLFEGTGEHVGMLNITLGTLAAAISGFLAIRFLIKMIKDNSLKPFAYYCWILGSLAILSYFI